MRIAVTSQNFRTVSGHAGKARRFMIFDVDDRASVRELARLDLPPELAMHGFDDHFCHPLDEADILLTGSSGEGFVRRMAQRGVRVIATAETDPETAVHAFLVGCLRPPALHVHDHPGDQPCGCHG